MRVGFRARQTPQPITWSSGPLAFQQGLCPSQGRGPGTWQVCGDVSVQGALRSPQPGTEVGTDWGPISTGFPAHQGSILVDPRVSGSFQGAGTKPNPRLEAREACAASAQQSVCPGGNSPRVPGWG